MKLFTVEEANELLPFVSSRLRSIQNLYKRLEKFRDEARLAAAAAETGGGMLGGTDYIRSLYQIGKLTTEISDLGVELKDHNRGLVDFPSNRGDRVVLLCWQLGEGEEISWWHEVETGFAGRKPL